MNSQLAELSTAARRSVEAGDWASVQACAVQIIQQDRASAEGYFLIGLCEKAAGRPLKAAVAFEKALEFDTGRHDAAVELANQYSVARRNGEAARLLRDYEQKLANSPLYLTLAGTVYTQIGLAERALPLFARANELQPGIDRFEANLATCCVYLGRIDEARELYRRLLERHPAHQRNHYEYARLQKAEDDDHLQQMQKLLTSQNLAPDQNVFLLYAIGKELEDLGRWDQAFHYYRMAGTAVSNVAKHDVQSDIALIDQAIASCTPQWLADAAQQPGNDGPTPLFVVGLPRTGTTLTERILSSHSQVQSLGETQFLQMMVRRESGVQSVERLTPEMIAGAAAVDPQRIADGYLDAVRYRLGDEPYFIDKMPLNFLFVGFIARAWPDARIVLLDRHPLDSCFAMYKQVFTWAYKFSYSLEQLGRYYIAYDRLRSHWSELLGDRLVRVRYESLVSNQETETRALLDRLGLDFEPACLEFDSNPAASATASSVQVREKIHSRSVGRWRNFETHLAPLTQQLQAAGIDVS